MCISHLLLRAPLCSSAFAAFGLNWWFGTTTISKRKRRNFTTSSQVCIWRQHTLYILLAGLLFLSLEINGEPHTNFHAMPQPSAFYVQQQLASGGSNGSGEVPVIQHQTITSIPEQTGTFILSGNQRDVTKENIAPVMASSFRTVDSQAVNSNEEIGYGYRNLRSKRKPEKNCSRKVPLKCLEELPPMTDIGIPSSPQAVENACRFYDSGISCVDKWMKKCLPESQRQQLLASITGAHETFTFLCKDAGFRADFLMHKDCYKKLSPYWDDCSRQFVDGLKKNSKRNNTAFCCIRLEFLQCVRGHSIHLCGTDATKFSMKMAETLVRSSRLLRMPKHCVAIRNENCIPINASFMTLPQIPSSTTCFIAVISLALVHLFGAD